MTVAGDEKEEGARSSWLPIIVASICSCVWVVLAGFLGFNAADGRRIWPLTNLSANEWGDFLAGVAGTLAFIWLIATVFIQSKELRLQRNELKDNRKVANEQARYIGEQTKLLQLESTERRNALVLQGVDAVTARIENVLSSRSFRGLAVHFDQNGSILFPSGRSLTLIQEIRATYQRFRNATSGFYQRDRSFSEHDFFELYYELGEWQNLSAELNPDHSILRKNASEIEMLIAIVDAILEVDQTLRGAMIEGD